MRQRCSDRTKIINEHICLKTRFSMRETKMEYKVFGEMKIPILGLGTWRMGGKFEPDLSQKHSSIKAIQKAIDLGITHIDTSEIYGKGFTEELIGKAIEPYKRSDLFLTSKVWSTHLNYSGVIQAFKSTLKRLKADYLDIYLIHRPSIDMDLRGTMKALEYLNEIRLARAIGVSNFTVQQIVEAEKYLTKSKIFAVQNEYNLFKREQAILDFCKQKKIIFIAYRPLMKGHLTKQEIPILSKLAKKYDKTNAQIALNWLVSKEQIVAIPKAIRKKHLEEIAKSVGWRMSTEDYKSLDNINYKNIR